ncbi:WhiB family transcriptional regulator [Rhodococcus opacus]|uniref:WhiB family transcriptional regulator n=1 Tax=Rhodococcus opacus TaxID=37919 RepID=UPI001F221F59|nr:WhiB family transcriptional regulator [Rhodococcus opacus]
MATVCRLPGCRPGDVLPSRQRTRPSRGRAAKQICLRCPVWDLCLNCALDSDERHGISTQHTAAGWFGVAIPRMSAGRSNEHGR